MKFRKFGSIDWQVSEIGLGCWAMGADWGDVSEDSAKEILRTSFDNGVNFFDTADVYGDGRSERFVGEFINSTSERIYVATKAGRRINPHEAAGYYDKDLMESFVDRSLKNLNIDTIDLLQMHCPPTAVYSNNQTYEMLDYLVNKGKIQHYGFSVESVEQAMECIQRSNTKSVQIIFNMLRLKPAEEFFKLAKDKNIAIIVRVPLASGLLTGKLNLQSTFPENDHRNYNINGDAFDIGETFSGVDYKKALEVVEEIKLLVPRNFSLSQLALKWILMHEAVSVIIPGAKNSDQVLRNISASSLADIHNLMQKIEDIYNTYLKTDIHPRW